MIALLETILATGVDALLDEGLIKLKKLKPLDPNYSDFEIHHRDHGHVGNIASSYENGTISIDGMNIFPQFHHKSPAIALGTVRQLKDKYKNFPVTKITAMRISGRKQGEMQLNVPDSGRIHPSDTFAQRVGVKTLPATWRG